MLQVRIELTTSALLCYVLPYKYRALTDCATGASEIKSNINSQVGIIATSAIIMTLILLKQTFKLSLENSTTLHHSLIILLINDIESIFH